jgi:hypothetical protein
LLPDPLLLLLGTISCKLLFAGASLSLAGPVAAVVGTSTAVAAFACPGRRGLTGVTVLLLPSAACCVLPPPHDALCLLRACWPLPLWLRMKL